MWSDVLWGLDAGEEVGVWRPGSQEPEAVGGVLVAPAGTSDEYPSRMGGSSVSLDLYFPSTYGASLLGCEVEVGGRRYAVVGDPAPYPAGLVPGPWDRVVSVVDRGGR